MTKKELLKMYPNPVGYDAIHYSGIVLHAFNDAELIDRVLGMDGEKIFVVRLHYSLDGDGFFILKGRRYKLSNFMRFNR